MSIYSVCDQYCLLMTTTGFLRGESLFNCKLSKFGSLLHNNKDKNSLKDILIHVMCIATTGKTNGLKALHGCCIQHHNVNECTTILGMLGFYLMARCMQSGEA